MSYNNQNLFQDTVVFGNFINADSIKTGGATANAKFKRNVIVGGDLNLGRELSTTTDGVISYENTGGNITFKINGTTYTITPTILKHLSSITSDYATTISNKAPLASPSFTGVPLAPTPTTEKNNTEIATTAFVKAQGYITTVTPPDLSTYLTTELASTTYQTISNMTNYLTTATASTTYQTISNMTNYLTTATASTTYQTISNMTNYLTTATASTTYQTISSMTNYALKDSPIFINKITTPYVSLSNPSYIELQGDYTGRKGTYYLINSYEATYNSLDDIFGYSSNNNSNQDYSLNYPNLGVYRGCFFPNFFSGSSSLNGGWDGVNFVCSVSGKYQINITFYIKSNTAGNKFMLKYFDVNNILKDSQYCLVEGTITTDTVRTFSTILNMTVGGYFNIKMTTWVGATKMYFFKSEYSSMKVILLG